MIAQAWSLVSHLLPLGGTLIALGTDPPGTVVWSEEVHRTICEIAWRELTAESRRHIRQLLSEDHEYSTFADACAWADRVRRSPRYIEYRTAHYVNVTPGAPGVNVDTHCADDLCVLEAITQFAAILGDRSQETGDRLVALKFLAHFVGDIHQPLHVGYAADRGGNTRRVTVASREYNLHELWDRVVASSPLGWRERAVELHDRIDPIDRRIWGASEPIVWANESYQIVENEVYGDLDGNTVSEVYLLRHRRTAETRIVQAGLRLGGMLNGLLDPGA